MNLSLQNAEDGGVLEKMKHLKDQNRLMEIDLLTDRAGPYIERIRQGEDFGIMLERLTFQKFINKYFSETSKHI